MGKTFVTAALAASFNLRCPEADIRVWKPVQSGVVRGEQGADSHVLRMACGNRETEKEIATFSFPEPLAPWIAAQKAGVEIPFERLVEVGKERATKLSFFVRRRRRRLLVPLTQQHTVHDLIAALGFPVLVVARPSLGTVNHTLLTISKLKASGIRVQGVILNGYKPEQVRHAKENAAMIEHFSGVPVLGCLPWNETPYPEHEVGWKEWRCKMAAWVETLHPPRASQTSFAIHAPMISRFKKRNEHMTKTPSRIKLFLAKSFHMRRGAFLMLEIRTQWDALAQKALAGERLTKEEALSVLRADDDELLPLLQAAYEVRKTYFGKKVKLNLIINAKSGLCPEIADIARNRSYPKRR